MDIKLKLREALLKGNEGNLTLFHGTIKRNVESIKSKGLVSNSGYDSPKWFVLSTDFESALYHASPENGGDEVYVFEFKVPVSNEPWFGYPYLWPGYLRGNVSTWYALRQPIEPDYTVKLHTIPNEHWLNQKNIGY